MALQRAVGIAVAVSTTLPASHDAAGFQDLTYTTCGKLNSVPDLDGTHDIATFDNLETGEEEKFADIFRAGSGELMLGFDDEDAGQSALEGAKGSKVALKLSLSGGAVWYRIAVITSYRPTNFSAGNVVMASVGLEFEKTSVKTSA